MEGEVTAPMTRDSHFTRMEEGVARDWHYSRGDNVVWGCVIGALIFVLGVTGGSLWAYGNARSVARAEMAGQIEAAQFQVAEYRYQSDEFHRLFHCTAELLAPPFCNRFEVRP